MGHDDADGLDEGWDAMAKLRSWRHTSRKLCEPFAGGCFYALQEMTLDDGCCDKTNTS
jgi:hypothetical protein